MDLTLLKEPFPENDIEWRPQRSGVKKNGDPYAMTLAYVTNRAVMDRLDAVVGLSGAMKRAAVQWGIGRYLYNLPATFGNFHQYGKNSIKINNNWHKYDNPALPSEFLPTTKGK